jgi:hypothetical protein
MVRGIKPNIQTVHMDVSLKQGDIEENNEWQFKRQWGWVHLRTLNGYCIQIFSPDEAE